MTFRIKLIYSLLQIAVGFAMVGVFLIIDRYI